MARQKARDHSAEMMAFYRKGNKMPSQTASSGSGSHASRRHNATGRSDTGDPGDRTTQQQQQERQSSEDYSLNSSSTDSTRPTVHTKRAAPSSSASMSTEDHSSPSDGRVSRSRNYSSTGSGSTSKGYLQHSNGTGTGSGGSGGSSSMVNISNSNSNSHSHANNSHGKTRRGHKNRQRVPGGAAAKLMFRGPRRSESSSDLSYSDNFEPADSQDDGPIDTSEIYDMINRTRAEFETGRRMSPVAISTVGTGDIEVSFSEGGDNHQNNNTSKKKGKNGGDDDSKAEGQDAVGEVIPHILNRDEAYHENASAAVAAILTPQKGDNASMVSGITDLHSTLSGHRMHMNYGNSSVSAFQSPKYADGGSVGSNGSNTANEELFDVHQGAALRKSPTTEPFISGATEAKLDRMSQKMLDPSKTLSDLLRAIASPADVTTMDRAFMVRRKNACGALKVLTAHNRRRKQICWTVGVLPALTSVLQDAGDVSLELVYPDVRTRTEYEEARRRAIAALTNLSMPVSNRLAVFHTPGLVQALIATINSVDGDCLEGACATLAYLAKSNENRILMAQVPGLFEAVLRVLRPTMNEEQSLPDSPKQQEYPWTSSVSESESGSVTSAEEHDDDEEDEDFDDDLEEEASILSGSTHTSSEGGSSDEDDEMDADTTDDDMSTDHESMTGSEGSTDASDSESSGDESRSDYRPPPAPVNKRKSPKGHHHHKKNVNSVKPKPKPKQMAPASTPPRPKLHSDYDRDKCMSAARKNLFAMLGHLVKEKDNAYRLARVNELVPVVVEISKMHDSPIHVLAVQLLAHLTRHRLNSKSLVFKMQVVIQAMVRATYSNNEISRRYACFAIQNFSHDKSCRQELASSEKLITALCKRARHSKDPEERLAAICALKNLTDEPANLIPLSNTAECIATLMQIAHGQEEGVTEMMQFRACDALATISHWLRKIATNGQTMDAAKHGDAKPKNMFVPSLKVIGWEQFE